MIDSPFIISRDLRRAPLSHQYSIFNVKTDRIVCQIRFTDRIYLNNGEISGCFVVHYLVETLTLSHGLLQLKMKEHDLILMNCQSSLSVVPTDYEKET